MLDKLSTEIRLLIAVVISLGFFAAWQFVFPPPKKAPRAPAEQVDVAAAPPSGVGAETAPGGPPPVVLTPSPAPATAVPATSPTTVPGQEAVVETQLFRAVFSSVDGGLQSFQLKEQREGVAPDSPPIEMVHVTGAEARPLRVDVLGGPEGTRAAPVRFDRLAIDLVGGAYRNETLVETAEVEPGLELVKRFTFSPNSYVIDIEAELRSTGDRAFNHGIVAYWVQESPAKQDRYTFVGPEAFVDGNLKKIQPAKLQGVEEFREKLFWIGYGDKYFLGAFIPRAEDRPGIRGQIARSQAGNIYTSLVYPPAPLAPGATRAYRWSSFIGPKEIDILKEAGSGLQYSLDYGWFGFISRPMVYALKFFHGFTHNWGLAIILLTIVVKGLFYPLTHKSYTSMKAMQKLQPEMKRLKERLKDNKEELNRELMELYRRHKVNPFAGCFPIVLQIPVFFGLYRALLNSIELRHAPFGLWIHDLSMKDPYYITPVIMGVTMFLQQKMTPSTMDPAQARIMQFMPLLFTFMFLQFPSGLVIYWLVSNVLSIVQQYLINRKTETAAA